MFGKKTKRIKELESVVSILQEMKDKRDAIIAEIREVLEVPVGQDVRAHVKALKMSHETNLNLIQGAAQIIQKADKWFVEQQEKKAKRVKREKV